MTSVLHALHQDQALWRCHQGNLTSEHADVPAVVEVCMCYKNRSHTQRWIGVYLYISRQKVLTVYVKPGQEIEVYQIVNATSVPAPKKLLVKCTIFAKVLPKVQKDSRIILLKVYLVPTNPMAAVVDC